MMRTALALILLSMLAPAVAAPATDWFPPFVQEAAAEDLANKLAPVGGGTVPAAERLGAARVAVQQLVHRVDAWGLDGLLERVPTFPELASAGLEIPSLEDPRIAALARYGICGLPLDPSGAPDDSTLVDEAMGEIAIGVVAGLLRHEILAEGGTDEQLQAELASEPMNALSHRIAGDDALKRQVRARCSGVLTGLLE